ncbi:hypothetical protein COHA_006000 [Chlorella ohadii]|uniref:Uncharacterized protein n=1 Tax=Chlorella ohadii TaxID=2649997 RepID=A0AAD5DPP6_9CHLO|nr:hypothetical protein COHA_006000 [Chlorella ohadii]
MGGGGDLHVPKEIWSPAGGFYADPKRWKRNTAVIGLIIAGIAAYAFKQSVQMEQRHKQPYESIPSQRWYTEKNFPQQ